MTDVRTNGLASQVSNYITTVMERDYIGFIHEYLSTEYYNKQSCCGNYVSDSHSVGEEYILLFKAIEHLLLKFDTRPIILRPKIKLSKNTTFLILEEMKRSNDEMVLQIEYLHCIFYFCGSFNRLI